MLATGQKVCGGVVVFKPTLVFSLAQAEQKSFILFTQPLPDLLGIRKRDNDFFLLLIIKQ